MDFMATRQSLGPGVTASCRASYRKVAGWSALSRQEHGRLCRLLDSLSGGLRPLLNPSSFWKL